MTDQEILKKLHLSDAEATDLCHKIAGLKPAQAKVLAHATTDPSEAAAALGPHCSADDLQRFLNARKGDHPSAACIYFAPKGDAD